MKNYNIVYSTMSFHKDTGKYKREISYYSNILNYNIVNTIIFPKKYYENKSDNKYPVIFIPNINNELDFLSDKLYDFANDNNIIFIVSKFKLNNDYNLYKKYIINELLPYIKSVYTVNDKFGIYSINNGSILSLELGNDYSDIFKVICLSCPLLNNDILNINNLILYIDDSEERNNIDNTKQLVKKLKKNNKVEFKTYHNINDEDYYFSSFDNYIEIFNKYLK